MIHACFNQVGAEGAQITVVMHVDDLFVVSMSDASLAKLKNYMRKVYKDIKVSKGKVLDYRHDFRQCSSRTSLHHYGQL